MEHFDSITRLLDEYPNLLGADLLPYGGPGGQNSQCSTAQPHHFCPPSAAESMRWEAYFMERGYHQVRLVRP